MSDQQKYYLAMLVMPALLLASGVAFAWARYGFNTPAWILVILPALMLVALIAGSAGFAYGIKQVGHRWPRAESNLKPPVRAYQLRRALDSRPAAVVTPLVLFVIGSAMCYGIQYLGAGGSQQAKQILDEAARTFIVLGCTLGALLGSILGGLVFGSRQNDPPC